MHEPDERACEQDDDDAGNDRDKQNGNADHGESNIIDALADRCRITEETKMEVKPISGSPGMGRRFRNQKRQEDGEPEDFFEEEDSKHQKLLLREIKALMDSDKEGAASWMAYINGPEATRQSAKRRETAPADRG